MCNSLKYPIGQFKASENISNEELSSYFETIKTFPSKLRTLTEKLSEAQLDTCYRENGWTIRQVVHHCADSHHNSYTRFKWTLTEDTPTIKAYNEAHWAELEDGKHAPIELSLQYLEALHAKWHYLLVSLSESDFLKCFIHPESAQKINLKTTVAMYAWHCDHHYAHIFNLATSKNWV